MNRSARLSLRSLLRHWPLLVALALYLALALPRLDLPGLHYDEALEAATPAALLLNHQPVTIVNNGGIELGGAHWPLMVQNHIGAIQIYAAMPFIVALGPTTVALRLMTVLIGALTLVGVYLFIAQVYGRAAAEAGVIWLAVFPSFVFWSRQGVFVTNISPALAAWAFAAGARWWRKRGSGMLFCAALLAGLAVYAKLSALWLLNGSALWFALVWLANRRAAQAQPAQHATRATLGVVPQPFPRFLRREYGVALAGFFLGVLPVVLYNLITGFKTFSVVESSASTTYLGTSNLDVVGNFQTRVAQFADVLRSGEHLWYLGGPFPNQLSLVSVVVALAIIIGMLAVRRGREWHVALFAPFLVLACIAQSCFTISALWFTHFAISVWLPAVVVGAAVGMLVDDKRQTIDHRRQKFFTGLAVLVALVIVLASQIQTNMLYLDAMRLTGGVSFHSTAIEDVSRFLAARSEHVIALDWGFSAQIEYLTNGQKRVEELYGFTHEPPPDFAITLKPRFSRDELYLTHVANEEAFPRRQAFLDAVAAAGMRAETVNVSVRRDGLPLIEVWRVVKP